MESELRVPEKHGSEQRDCDCDISQVEFKPFDRDDQWNQKTELLGLVWEFLYKVQQEDTSYPVSFEIGEETVTVTQLEAELLRYLYEGAKIQIAYYNGKQIGYMLYHSAYDCILLIRHMYLEPDFAGLGIGKKMVESIGEDTKRVFFQTRKNNPPEELLDQTENFRIKVKETSKLITWEMPWRK